MASKAMDELEGIINPPYTDAELTSEVWRSIKGLESYSVSNLGRVRRDVGGRGATAGRILRPSFATDTDNAAR